METTSVVKNEREVLEGYANVFAMELKNDFIVDGNSIRLVLKNGTVVVLRVKKIV